MVFCRWSSCWCFAGGRLVGVLPAAVLPMSLCFDGENSRCRRNPVMSVLCRCRTQPRSEPGDLRECREPEKALGASEGRRKAERPRQCEEARPSRIAQFLCPRVLWFGKSTHQTGACLILCDPNQFATRREAIFIARKHYFAAYLPLCLCASVLLLKFRAEVPRLL